MRQVACRHDGAQRSSRPAPVPRPPKAIADRIKSGGAALDGQRRQVTVLFADLVGYAPLAERLDEEAVYQLMQSVLKPMIDAVHIQAGTVQELAGNGTWPSSVPLWPSRTRQFERVAPRSTSKTSFPCSTSSTRQVMDSSQVRIGIHTGPVVVGKIGDDLRMKFTALGDTSTFLPPGMRAEPGTCDQRGDPWLVQGYAESEFLGTRSVKGKSEPQQIYRLKGLRAGVTQFDVSVRRGLAPFVGRSAELAVFEHAGKKRARGRYASSTSSASLGSGNHI